MKIRFLIVMLIAFFGFFTDASQASADVSPQPASEHEADKGSNPKLPESLPLLRDKSTDNQDAVKSLWISLLILILGVIAFIIAYCYKRAKWNTDPPGYRRSNNNKSKPKLDVIISKRLSSKLAIHVIEWEGDRILVGCGDGFMSVLAVPSTAKSPSVCKDTHE